MSTQSRQLSKRQPGIKRHDHADEIAERDHQVFEIRKQAQGSILMCVLAFIAITPFIGGPAALYMGRQALANIAQHGVGQQYATMASVGKNIGLALTVLAYGAALVLLVIVILMSAFGVFQANTG